jgi:hypothetical protein
MWVNATTSTGHCRNPMRNSAIRTTGSRALPEPSTLGRSTQDQLRQRGARRAGRRSHR